MDHHTNHTNILLYSKFSPASRKMVEMIDNLPNFNLLCIDNKKTRERILKSEKLGIKEVPSIIRVQHDTGYSELFEGDRAFKLLNTYKSLSNQNTPPPKKVHFQSPLTQESQEQPVQSQVSIQTPQQPIQQPPQQVSMIQQPPQQTNLMQQQPSQQVSMIQPIQQPQQLEEGLPRYDSIQKQQKLINATSIEDLGTDINKGQTMNTYIHVPKSVEFDIDIENRQRSVKTDRSVKNDGGNIVNRAMQMQKEREQESSFPGSGQRPISM
jgi:hypothetical protein